MKKRSLVGSGTGALGATPTAEGKDVACNGVPHSQDLIKKSAATSTGSDVIIVVLVAESGRECDDYGQGAPRHRFLGRIRISDGQIAQTICEAIGAGAADPSGTAGGELVASVARGLEPREDATSSAWNEDYASTHFANLTPRQREIMELVLAGHPNKIIAADLGISQRTVENHRASIMKKTGAKSLPALVRLAMIAGKNEPPSASLPALSSRCAESPRWPGAARDEARIKRRPVVGRDDIGLAEPTAGGSRFAGRL
jgi:DNA-binding NarL/FixJ family response regulator